MTEDQAREKWCPFARVTEVDEMGNSNACDYNRQYHPSDVVTHGYPAQCVASDCMAWRWKLDADLRQMVDALDNGKQIGYCGLAGKP